MYKVSVIMPIYNGEKYLEKSLNSIINQTIGFENIELILVDDKSTDNSKTILKEYSKNYSNIKTIFLEENSGCPGIPRNIGIKNATSDYIMFIDDDDEYSPEICNNLYNTIILEDVDIVACECVDIVGIDDYNPQFKKKEVFDKIYLIGEEIIYFKRKWGFVSSIFKKSIILDNNIYFYSIPIAEDLIFLLNYHIHSKKLLYLNDFVGYYHIIRNDSISPTSFNNIKIDMKSFYIMAEILKKNKCDLSRYFKIHIQQFIFKVINVDGKENISKNEIKEALGNLADFERRIYFKGKLSFGFQFINFFILHGNLNMATYICLFISKTRKSNLVLNIYRKFFLKFHK